MGKPNKKEKKPQKKQRSSAYFAKAKKLGGGGHKDVNPQHITQVQSSATTDQEGTKKYSDFERFYPVGKDYYERQDWDSLVVQTKKNDKFSNDYTFDQEDGLPWVRAKPYGDWCAGNTLPLVLAIDCEMCETTDPVTKHKEKDALVRFSVVDGCNPSHVVFDSLVRPINDIRYTYDTHYIPQYTPYTPPMHHLYPYAPLCTTYTPVKCVPIYTA